ncbi:MAG: SRPBCC family protein [Thermoleophilia bacterium]
MPRFRDTVPSSRSAEETFAYLAAFERVSEWDPSIESSVRVDDGTLRVGSSFDVVVRMGSGPLALRYTVTRLDPPRSIELEARSGRFDILDAIHVEPAGDGATVTYETTLATKGLWRLASPLVQRALDRLAAEAMTGLRRRLSVG